MSNTIPSQAIDVSRVRRAAFTAVSMSLAVLTFGGCNCQGSSGGLGRASGGLEFTPTAIDFGVIPVGMTASRDLELHNAALSAAQISGGTFSDNDRFQMLAPPPGTLSPDQDVHLTVRFQPRTAGIIDATLSFAVNIDGAPQMMTVQLHGVGEAGRGDPMPGVCVLPTMLNFGSASSHAQDVTVTACGDHDVTITGLDWTRADAAFALRDPPALPFGLARGASKVVTVQFTPPMSAVSALLTVKSDDPVSAQVPVAVSGTPDVVPPSAGKFLYYWSAWRGQATSDIMRFQLQGGPAPQAFWGTDVPGSVSTSGCPGCHQVSPDGRYLAVVEISTIDNSSSLYILDTGNKNKLSVPAQVATAQTFSWRPDVKATPTYQFVAAAGGSLYVGSLTAGTAQLLSGASDPATSQAMPTWGSKGKIAFVRGALYTDSGTAYRFLGPSDLMLIPETGGTPTPVAGASGNNMANYYPTFSPNGDWISFTQSARAQDTFSADDAQIRLVKADGSQLLQLSNLNGTVGASSYPSWSSDGTYLSFSSNRPGGAGDWDVYIAPIDPVTGVDGMPTNVTAVNTSKFEHGVEWSQ